MRGEQSRRGTTGGSGTNESCCMKDLLLVVVVAEKYQNLREPRIGGGTAFGTGAGPECGFILTGKPSAFEIAASCYCRLDANETNVNDLHRGILQLPGF